MLYLLLCVARFWSESQKAFLPLCGWVCLVSEVSGCHSPLFVRGKNAALCRTTRAPQPGMRCGNARPAAPGWTSQVRHRLLSSRSPASSSSSWQTQTKRSRAQTSCAELKLEELAPVDLKQNKHDCQQQNLRQDNNCRLQPRLLGGCYLKSNFLEFDQMHWYCKVFAKC